MNKDKVREALEAFETKMGKPLGNPDLYVVRAGDMCEALKGLRAALSALAAAPEVEWVREVLDAWRAMEATPFTDAHNSTAPWSRAYMDFERKIRALAALAPEPAAPSGEKFVPRPHRPPGSPVQPPHVGKMRCCWSHENGGEPSRACEPAPSGEALIYRDGFGNLWPAPTDEMPLMLPAQSAQTPEAAGPILADAQTRALAGWRKPTDAAPSGEAKTCSACGYEHFAHRCPRCHGDAEIRPLPVPAPAGDKTTTEEK